MQDSRQLFLDGTLAVSLLEPFCVLGEGEKKKIFQMI